MPSTVPCNPAPGRRLIIMRTDTQTLPAGSFLAFDGLVPHHPSMPPSGPNMAWKRRTTLSPAGELDSRPTSSASSETGSDVERERGLRGFLRSVMGGSKARAKSRGPPPPAVSKRLSIASSPSSAPSPSPALPDGLARSVTGETQASRLQTPGTLPGNNDSQAPAPAPAPAPAKFRSFCFKFSLEFNPKHQGPGALRLVPPRLPKAAQAYVLSQSSEISSPSYMFQPVRPTSRAEGHCKYAGRALAEWAMVVSECQSFFDRRKNEGAPEDKYVETPQLAVEVMTKKVG